MTCGIISIWLTSCNVIPAVALPIAYESIALVVRLAGLATQKKLLKKRTYVMKMVNPTLLLREMITFLIHMIVCSFKVGVRMLT